MPVIQQTQDIFEIKKFLMTHYSGDITQLKLIRGGERSKAFLFESGGDKYIFRKNTSNFGFQKDRYAFDHFSNLIPIPKVIKIGQFQEGFYAVSEMCKGIPLEDSAKELPLVLIDSILLALDDIHAVPVPEQFGYGIADIQGKAEYYSWKQWVFKKNTPVTKNNGDYYSWDEIKKIDFVDNKIIDQLFVSINELIEYVPVDKYLIHGDFATGNIIIDNNLVTGVIDWNEFGYGDFLFDVAWLDFWIGKTDFALAYKRRSQKNNRNISDYKERIRCHKLFIGLNTLGIYAAIGWKERYLSTLERIKKIYF